MDTHDSNRTEGDSPKETKFVLHGGFTKKQRPCDGDFFREIMSGLEGKITILLVEFAKEAIKVPGAARRDIDLFSLYSDGRALRFLVANRVTFIDQLSQADVVYFHGGDTLQLQESMAAFLSFRSAIAGKVVAGESAGAYLLSAAFFSKTIGELREGLGLVPVAIICHYTGESEDRLPEDIEHLLLPEHTYRVF